MICFSGTTRGPNESCVCSEDVQPSDPPSTGPEKHQRLRVEHASRPSRSSRLSRSSGRGTDAAPGQDVGQIIEPGGPHGHAMQRTASCERPLGRGSAGHGEPQTMHGTGRPVWNEANIFQNTSKTANTCKNQVEGSYCRNGWPDEWVL